MGGICSGKSASDVPQGKVLDKNVTSQQKKWIKHEGEQFKDDDEAQTAAEAWLVENAGYEFKGKHKVVKGEGEDGKTHSEFEVHKKVEPAVIENPAVEEREEVADVEGDKVKEEVGVEAPQENRIEEEVAAELMVSHENPAAGLGAAGIEEEIAEKEEKVEAQL